MAFEHLSAEVSLLMNQMRHEPDDSREMYLLLAEQLNELRAFGLRPPPDLLELEKALRNDLAAHSRKRKPH